MASVNKAILIGNLGRDAELRHTPNGQPVSSFSIATNDRWTDRESGEKKERTEWHRIVLWGKTAENINQYLKSGKQVYIEGRLQTREWLDKEGIKRYTTEVVAQVIQLLGGGNGSVRPPHPASDDSGNGEPINVPEDEIPF